VAFGLPDFPTFCWAVQENGNQIQEIGNQITGLVSSTHKPIRQHLSHSNSATRFTAAA